MFLLPTYSPSSSLGGGGPRLQQPGLFTPLQAFVRAGHRLPQPRAAHRPGPGGPHHRGMLLRGAEPRGALHERLRAGAEVAREAARHGAHHQRRG